MKPRRHRIPPRPTQVVNVLHGSDRVCPYCNETYNVSLPVLGGNGVSVGYSHRIDADSSRWCFHSHTFTDFENDLDADDFCGWEISDTPMGEGVAA